MQVYDQDGSRLNCRRNETEFYVDNQRRMIQTFKYDSDNNRGKVSPLHRKRQSYREKRRKDDLKSYFEKRRIDLFGWKSNDEFVFESLLSNQVQLQQSHYSRIQKRQIDTITNPAYSDNYFKDVILLEKLIAEDDLKQSNNQTQGPENYFKFKTFYSFLITTIQQSLHQSYFQRFEDNNIFLKHFNVLKNVLYKKLAQQMQDLLISVQNFNLSFDKRNTWAYRQILQETYSKLIYQLTTFIKSQNLQYGCKSDWPIIPIQEQITFLLKMLIEVAYYDENETYDQHTSNEENEYFSGMNKRLNDFFEQNYENDTVKVPMTKILLQNTDLLDTLKFMIVFGVPNEDGQSFNEDGNTKKDKKRRQKIISLIVVLLRNISINEGSDVFFEDGMIGELRCQLKEPCFRVEIRKNRLKKKSSSMVQKSPFQMRVESFIVDAFQLIRDEKSRQYLSAMDSFQFVFDFLEHILLRIEDDDKEDDQNERNEIIVGDEIGLFDYEDDDIELEGRENQSEVGFMRAVKNERKSQLMALAEQCIECLEFHLLLGQIRLNNAKIIQQQARFEDHTFCKEFQNTNQKAQSYPHNHKKRFSSSNPYVVKFNYIPNGEEVLRYFEKGQQLVEKIFF